MTEDLAHILDRPIVEWPEAIESSVGNPQDLELELAGLMQRAVLLYSYLEHSKTSGCGKQPHEDSVAYANKTLCAVRKVMGYIHPERGIKMQ